MLIPSALLPAWLRMTEKEITGSDEKWSLFNFFSQNMSDDACHSNPLRVPDPPPLYLPGPNMHNMPGWVLLLSPGKSIFTRDICGGEQRHRAPLCPRRAGSVCPRRVLKKWHFQPRGRRGTGWRCGRAAWVLGGSKSPAPSKWCLT